MAMANPIIFDIAGPPAYDVDTDDPATVVQLNVAQTGSITNINVLLSIFENGEQQPCCFIDNLDITLSHNGIDVLLIYWFGCRHRRKHHVRCLR